MFSLRLRYCVVQAARTIRVAWLHYHSLSYNYRLYYSILRQP